jgi:integrase
MTIRKRRIRSGDFRLFIEITYRTADGSKHRFRRDAQIQTRSGALAEERRLFAELERTGTLRSVPEPPAAPVTVTSYTFSDAVRQFRATRMKTLKPSTRLGYEARLNGFLVPRFGDVALADLDKDRFVAFDAELINDELAASTRRGLHIVFRSVLRSATEAGLLGAMPTLPRFPKVGRKVVQPMHRDDLDAILAASSSNAQLAFALAAFAGLRAGEVRGLRWTDVDLKGGNISVRRALTQGEATTPKSGSHRVVPIATPLRMRLESAATTRANPWAPVATTSLGKVWGEFGLNQAFQRAQARARRSGWSFHDLRHFFVTELFRRGAPAPAVQRLAGHADLATTERYADMVASDLRAAVALFDGNSVATATGRDDGRS